MAIQESHREVVPLFDVKPHTITAIARGLGIILNWSQGLYTLKTVRQSMTSEVDVEITGDKAVESAIKILQTVEQNEGSKRVRITITDLSEVEETPDEEPHEKGKSEGDEKETERYEGDIRANTSHHRALYAIAELTTDDEMISGNEVVAFWEGENETSIRPALTHLYKRMLVDRERVEAANPYYQYQITAHGKEVLNELGKPE